MPFINSDRRLRQIGQIRRKRDRATPVGDGLVMRKVDMRPKCGGASRGRAEFLMPVSVEAAQRHCGGDDGEDPVCPLCLFSVYDAGDAPGNTTPVVMAHCAQCSNKPMLCHPSCVRAHFQCDKPWNVRPGASHLVCRQKYPEKAPPEWLYSVCDDLVYDMDSHGMSQKRCSQCSYKLSYKGHVLHMNPSATHLVDPEDLSEEEKRVFYEGALTCRDTFVRCHYCGIYDRSVAIEGHEPFCETLSETERRKFSEGMRKSRLRTVEAEKRIERVRLHVEEMRELLQYQRQAEEEERRDQVTNNPLSSSSSDQDSSDDDADARFAALLQAQWREDEDRLLAESMQAVAQIGDD